MESCVELFVVVIVSSIVGDSPESLELVEAEEDSEDN